MNLVVVQSTRLGDSAGLQYTPEEVGCNASEGTDSPVRARARRQREQASFFSVLCIGCQWKV